MATLLGGSRWDNEEDIYEEAKQSHYDEDSIDWDEIGSHHFDD